MVAMVRYSSQAGCQAQHAIGSPTVCYLCLSRFLSSLYVSIPLFVRLSFAASSSPLRPSRSDHRRSVPCVSLLSRETISAILETGGLTSWLDFDSIVGRRRVLARDRPFAGKRKGRPRKNPLFSFFLFFFSFFL